MKAKGKLLIALLCVLIACIAWSPAVLAHCPDPMPTRPTIQQMAADPVVAAAIDAAWADSQANNATARHEEGGWILWNCATGLLMVIRWPAGGRDWIDPHPPLQEVYDQWGPLCWKVIGHFHTHPNPPVDENGKKWEQGPSEADNNYANDCGHPGIIRNRAGTEYFGPGS